MSTAVAFASRRAERDAQDRAALWRFQRALARVKVVEGIVADYATAYCGRPVRRREAGPLESAVQLPGVTWSIDGDLVVEYLVAPSGPAQLVVHDIALLRPLRKALRSRHISVKWGALG